MAERSVAASEERLRALSGWALAGQALKKSFELGLFSRALAFVRSVAELAESERSRPDILIESSRVTLSLALPREGSGAEKELDLTAKIEKLAREQGAAAEARK